MDPIDFIQLSLCFPNFSNKELFINDVMRQRGGVVPQNLTMAKFSMTEGAGGFIKKLPSMKKYGR